MTTTSADNVIIFFLSASDSMTSRGRWIPDWNKYQQCPTCGKMSVSSCKCMLNDQQCPDGHQWHYCAHHRRIILNGNDHRDPTCYCGAMPTIPMWQKDNE